MTKIKTHVLCCGGTGCKASAGDEIINNFNAILKEKVLKMKYKSLEQVASVFVKRDL